jgi:nicotinamidase/pyrazinamidase
MSKTALIIVDYQYDFLPGGALGVPDGNLARAGIIKAAAQKDVDLLVFSRDWHPPNHVSFSDAPTYRDGSWPPHCVQHTPGARIDPFLLESIVEDNYGVPRIVVTKGDDPDEEAYSAFAGHVTDGHKLAYVLGAQHKITNVRICGLALDYCVRATAVDAQVLGFDTTVLIDATRPVSYETGARAIVELVQRGVGVR